MKNFKGNKVRHNFWNYSTPEMMSKTCSDMILFGAEVFKNAKIIKDLDELKSINKELERKRKNGESILSIPIRDFVFNYLMDCIAILVYFENYMKAELIIGGFVVHRIDGRIEGFEELAKKQKKEPILIQEIHRIKSFEVDTENRIIYHNAIKSTTLGFNDLTTKKAYLDHYKFNNEILLFLKKLNLKRNQLHFYESLSFSHSESFIENIESLILFVDNTLRDKLR